MVDENKNIASDDEYQFPQEEYAGMSEDEAAASHSQGQASQSTTRQARRRSAVAGFASKFASIPLLKNKRVMGVIVVVIVGGIALHFMGDDSTVQKPAPKKTAQPPVQAQTQPQPQVQQVVKTEVPHSLYGELGNLRAHTSQTQTDISQLKAQIADLQNTVTTTSNENKALKASMTNLSGQVESLKNLLDKTLSRLDERHVKRITYHIRAVVPDRAWLTSNKGKTTTVTIGDKLKQYGFIKQIDADNGIIYTSSGRTIVYGPNDF